MPSPYVAGSLSGVVSATAVNAELAKIETAFTKLLSREYATDNALETNLDFNSNRGINLAAAILGSEAATLAQVRAESAVAKAENSTSVAALRTLFGTQATIIGSNSFVPTVANDTEVTLTAGTLWHPSTAPLVRYIGASYTIDFDGQANGTYYIDLTSDLTYVVSSVENDDSVVEVVVAGGVVSTVAQTDNIIAAQIDFTNALDSGAYQDSYNTLDERLEVSESEIVAARSSAEDGASYASIDARLESIEADVNTAEADVVTLQDDVVALENGVPTTGSTTDDGDGVEVSFTIPHSLGSTPDSVSVTPSTSDAAEKFWVSAVDATNITITYSAAPSSGTDNLGWYWVAYP